MTECEHEIHLNFPTWFEKVAYYLNFIFEYRTSVDDLFTRIHYVQYTPQRSGTYYYLVSHLNSMFIYISYVTVIEDDENWANDWILRATVITSSENHDILNALKERHLPKAENFLVLPIDEHLQGTTIVNMISLAFTLSGDYQLCFELASWHFRAGRAHPLFTKEQLQYQFHMKATRYIGRVGFLSLLELLKAQAQDSRKISNAISKLQEHFDLGLKSGPHQELARLRQQLDNDLENSVERRGSKRKNLKCNAENKRRKRRSAVSINTSLVAYVSLSLDT